MKFNYDTEILTHWIVITAHYWGKGESRDEAMKNCMKVKGSRARLRKWHVWCTARVRWVAGHAAGSRLRGRCR
jgi:hypothetical protein